MVAVRSHMPAMTLLVESFKPLKKFLASEVVSDIDSVEVQVKIVGLMQLIAVATKHLN